MQKKDILDLNTALERKKVGQDRALENRKKEWAASGVEIIREIALRLPFFTVDDFRIIAAEKGLWPQVKKGVTGSVFRQAAAQGIMRKTDQSQISKVKTNNGGLRYVWQSLIFKPDGSRPQKLVPSR